MHRSILQVNAKKKRISSWPSKWGSKWAVAEFTGKVAGRVNGGVNRTSKCSCNSCLWVQAHPCHQSALSFFLLQNSDHHNLGAI